MKKKPDLDGLAASKSLYDFEESEKTSTKLANPDNKLNLFPRPSLVPGVEYPTTEREEQLLDVAYETGYKDCMRMNRAGYLVEDSLLNLFRERVEQIRKEKIISGKIEPATKEERKWRLGL